MSLWDVKQPVENDARTAKQHSRLALQRKEAAEALSVGVDTFDRHIRPVLPVVHVGAVRLYPVEALEAWLAANARSTLEVSN